MTMEFEYDREADALYIRLRGGIVDRTIEIEAGTLVDVDPSGQPLGIEVVRPARPLPISDLADRFAVDQSTVTVLRSMWSGQERRFPFDSSKMLAAASG